MADNLQIPQNIADIVKINVTYTPESLTQFLTELANKIADLEKRVKELEERLDAIQGI